MNGELDERVFGAIIRSMLDIARNSENQTWFLEKEDFTSGEFTEDDWQRFLGCGMGSLSAPHIAHRVNHRDSGARLA